MSNICFSRAACLADRMANRFPELENIAQCRPCAD
jgi:hypothetical protein